eukprot:970522-Pelagomonas_calceolata.AAC.1
MSGMEEDKKKKKSGAVLEHAPATSLVGCSALPCADKKDKEGKEGKEKKEKKPKDEEGKEKKEKKHKDKEDGGSKEKKSSKKETAGQKAAPTAPPPRQPRGPPPRGPPKQSDDYMAGLDLPSSSDSEEEVERSARMDADEDQQPKLVQVGDLCARVHAGCLDAMCACRQPPIFMLVLLCEEVRIAARVATHNTGAV